MNEIATFGGGCYWCLDAFYRRIKGVNKVIAGYSGGHIENPSAERVYAGDTGHAEVIQIEFDPKIISYREIVEIFFVMHDPTTLNRQGNDVGEWYRSIIFYHNENQHQIAKEMIKHYAASLYKSQVVTQLQKFEKFWPAEESMQNYYDKNPTSGYCLATIDPKITKLRQKFATRLKDRTMS